MSSHDDAIVVITVTVTFDPIAGHTPPRLEEIAEHLIADERVSTVRIGNFGAPSVFRIDVPVDRPIAHAGALEPAVRTAAELGLTVVVASIVRGARNLDAVDPPVPNRTSHRASATG